MHAGNFGDCFFALSRFLPGFIQILEHGDEGEIEQYIRDSGSTKSVIITAVLQFVQVVSVICPGGPIQIAAGIIFGTFAGYLICHLSYIAANMSVFALSRRLGKRLDGLFSPEGEVKKLSFISRSRSPAYMVVLACMMPLLPNGIVPYVAARTKIKYSGFLLSMSLGSLPTILILCAVGSRLLEGDYLFSALLFGGMLLVITLLFVFRNRIISVAERFTSPKSAADGNGQSLD